MKRVAFLLALLVGVLAGVFALRLRGLLEGEVPAVRILSADDTACRPVGVPCTASGEVLALSLYLGQRVQPLVAFPVELTLQGAAAAQVSAVDAQFVMDGMEMGLTRFVLKPQPNGIWRGQAILPVCSNGRRDWHVTVGAGSGTQRYTATFGFQSDK